MSITNGRSFNDSELSRGFHLLTESKHTVKVNIPTVPPNTAHLYPRLAGSNWTCYLTQPCVVLGRSSSQQKNQKLVDVDLGESKQISRRHCEIRYSSRRDRWELYVYSRNGVKINHVIRKHKDKPVVLKTSALIEIDKTRFVFILPNNYIKPSQSEYDLMDTMSTPQEEELSLDSHLEQDIIQLFKAQPSMSTKELLEKLKETYDKTIEKENVLYLLVQSNHFQLAPTSVSLSPEESDLVTWNYISSAEKSMSVEKSASNLISLSKLFIEDQNDWSDLPSVFEQEELSIPANTTAQPSQNNALAFDGLSIESIYSVWIDVNQSQERPTKRTKLNSNEHSIKDIYKEIRTSIM